MSYDALQELLESEGIQLGDDGYTSCIRDGLFINLQSSPDGASFYLYIGIGEAPSSASDLLETVLELNMPGKRLDEGRIALHRATRTLVFTQYYALNTLEAPLAILLTRFAQTALGVLALVQPLLENISAPEDIRWGQDIPGAIWG